MKNLLRSDLMHKFLGGFVLGAFALATVQPASGRDALLDRAGAVVRSIS